MTGTNTVTGSDDLTDPIAGFDGIPDIFGYQDFRRYLADLFSYHHRQDSKYTKSQVCKEIGLANTRSYFNAVLNGRIVSKPKAQDFIRVFGLGKREAEYFRIMVHYDQSAPSDDERKWFYARLMDMRKERLDGTLGVIDPESNPMSKARAENTMGP